MLPAVTAETTEARTDEKPVAETPVVKAEPAAPPTKREFVAAKVAERAAKEGPKPDAPVVEAKSETPAGDEPVKPEVEAKAEKKEESAEAKPYTPDELKRELESKDIRDLDPKRIPPELKTMVAALQAAEGRKHKKLNDQIAAMEQKIADLDQKLTTGTKQDEAKPEAEADEGTSLLSKDEIKEIYKSPAGKAALAETLEELGYARVDAKEAADSRLFRDALTSVKADDERLQDDSFFDETVKAIGEDEKLSAIVKKDGITGAEIRHVFLTAANRVDKARIAKERETETAKIEKERKDLEAEREKLRKQEKEEINRGAPSSKAAGSRQTPVVAGEKLTYREFAVQAAANRKSS